MMHISWTLVVPKDDVCGKDVVHVGWLLKHLTSSAGWVSPFIYPPPYMQETFEVPASPPVIHMGNVVKPVGEVEVDDEQTPVLEAPRDDWDQRYGSQEGTCPTC